MPGTTTRPDRPQWRTEVYASHTFHEITNYYPMRAVRTDRYKLIYNIAWKLDFSFAADLWPSSTWQAELSSGSGTMDQRSIDAFLHRERLELYDLAVDPLEVHNLARDPEYARLVDSLSARLREFQRRTGDQWLHKWEYE